MFIWHFKGQDIFTEAVFLGGSDIDSEGNWTWLDHQPWQFDNFPDGEPNGQESENCLEMVPQAYENKPAGWWNDAHCGEKRAFICSYYNGIAIFSWVLKIR